MQNAHERKPQGLIDIMLTIPGIRELTLFGIAIICQFADPKNEINAMTNREDL